MSDNSDDRLETGSQYAGGDTKKSEAAYEMLSVRNLAHRVYYQCLFVFVVIGCTLVGVISADPYKYYVPVASHLIGYAGVITYLLVMLAMLTCSRDASTRFMLVIAVTLLLGVTTGFLFGINITLNSPNVQPVAGASSAGAL